MKEKNNIDNEKSVEATEDDTVYDFNNFGRTLFAKVNCEPIQGFRRGSELFWCFEENQFYMENASTVEEIRLTCREKDSYVSPKTRRYIHNY